MTYKIYKLKAIRRSKLFTHEAITWYFATTNYEEMMAYFKHAFDIEILNVFEKKDDFNKDILIEYLKNDWYGIMATTLKPKSVPNHGWVGDIKKNMNLVGETLND